MQHHRHNSQILTTLASLVSPHLVWFGPPLLTDPFTTASHAHFNHRELGATNSKWLCSRTVAALSGACKPLKYLQQACLLSASVPECRKT